MWTLVPNGTLGVFTMILIYMRMLAEGTLTLRPHISRLMQHFSCCRAMQTQNTAQREEAGQYESTQSPLPQAFYTLSALLITHEYAASQSSNSFLGCIFVTHGKSCLLLRLKFTKCFANFSEKKAFTFL